MEFKINWQAYYASHANFILAMVKGQQEARIEALKVQGMFTSGMVYTVGDILTSCINTSRNDEIWMNLTKIRIQGYLKHATGITREALLFAVTDKLGAGYLGNDTCAEASVLEVA